MVEGNMLVVGVPVQGLFLLSEMYSNVSFLNLIVL